MATLTKSRFLAGCQCPKRLWLELNEPLPPAPLVPLPVLEGRRVDAIVRELLPGVEVSRAQGIDAAVQETAALRAAGWPARMHQAAFAADDLIVVTDVVEHREGSLTLTEVKASTGVKDEHVSDVAFQALVMREAGVRVDRVQVMHVDGTFELLRAGAYDGLVRAADVTSLVESRLPAVEDAVGLCRKVMASRAPPAIRTGPQCRAPYDCPWLARCRLEEGGDVEYPIAKVFSRAAAQVKSLTRAGYRDVREVPAHLVKGRALRRIHAVTISGEPELDRAAAAPVTKLAYPIAYLDFETMAPAIPDAVGMRPYQNVPFQFSVQVEESETHAREVPWLAGSLPVDLDALAAALAAAIPEGAPVLAYNAGFEEGVLRDLAARVPAHSAALLSIADHLVDLLPVTRKAYCHPGMKGSWSFKAVLPTIDPAFDYGNLEGVQVGTDAQLAFLESVAPGTTPARRAQLREQLLAYCQRDTWGMVVLRRFMAGVAPR